MGDVSTSETPSAELALPMSSTTTENGLKVTLLAPGTTVPVHRAGTATEQIESGKLRIAVRAEKRYWRCTSVTKHTAILEDENGQPYTTWWWTYGWTKESKAHYQRCTLDLAKLVGGDASIDTRRTYGSPDVRGALPGDANAPLSTANFGAVDYKGGLFAGNMPSGTHDQSGTARVQLFLDAGGTGTHLSSLLSVYPTEYVARTGFASSFDIGVFSPPSVPTPDKTESSVLWDSKWNVEQRDSSGNLLPIGRATLAFPRPADDYFCIPIDGNRLFGGRVVLRLMDEPTDANGVTTKDSGTAGWFYLAGQEWQARHQTPPTGYTGFYAPRDSRPRVWRLGLDARINWSESAVSMGATLP
jgi:hypothetical protein